LEKEADEARSATAAAEAARMSELAVETSARAAASAARKIADAAETSARALKEAVEDSERVIAWAARQEESATENSLRVAACAAREKEAAAAASAFAACAAREDAAREKEEAAAAASAFAACAAREDAAREKEAAAAASAFAACAARENAARDKEAAAAALTRAVDEASLREAAVQHELDEQNSRSLTAVLRFVAPNGEADALLSTRSVDALTSSNAALTPSSRRNHDYKRAVAVAFDGLVDLLSGNDDVRAEMVLAVLTEHINRRRKEPSRDVRALDWATQGRTLLCLGFKASEVARWLRFPLNNVTVQPRNSRR
jgi:hypothetical protein